MFIVLGRSDDKCQAIISKFLNIHESCKIEAAWIPVIVNEKDIKVLSNLNYGRLFEILGEKIEGFNNSPVARVGGHTKVILAQRTDYSFIAFRNRFGPCGRVWDLS